MRRRSMIPWLMILALAGCAEATLSEDAGAPLDAHTAERSELDVPSMDLAVMDGDPRDSASADRARADLVTEDQPAPDVVTPDVVTPDVVTPDVVTPDVVMGPVRCTPESAASVCGGRPCVDGYCCEGPCDGPCRGCAYAGREGRCTNAPMGADPDDECAAQGASTCGTTGVCDGAGACARHPAGTRCDDGMSCTSEDRCDGAGTCRGAAPTACAPGAGNQCCVGRCDPMMGCATSPGLCADQCDGAVLRVARACQGCGAAGAVGLCGGGAEHTCNAVTHTACREVRCGGQTWRCTNDGGTWQWRTAARCDDGDPCTHGDLCASERCAGTRITCSSDACAARTCDGSARCAVTPRPGATCDDGNAMTNRDVCSSEGVCVGTVVCAVPADACADGTQSRDRCANARIIGRRRAASTSGFTVSDTTCRASNRFDDCSWDAGGDHAYRIWARSGERISASVTRGAACVGGSWSVTLKLYQGGDCGTVTCSRDLWCRDHLGTSEQSYTATRDGWIVVVVDGSTAFDDEGSYTLRVRLSGCAQGNCECP